MENFYIDTEFYSDIESYLSNNGIEDDDVINLEDDWSIKVQLSELKPMFQYKVDQITDDILRATDRWEENFPEDSDTVFKELEFAIKQSIDLEKLNSLIPKLYYPSGIFDELTKKDLLDYVYYTPPTEPNKEERK